MSLLASSGYASRSASGRATLKDQKRRGRHLSVYLARPKNMSTLVVCGKVFPRGKAGL